MVQRERERESEMRASAVDVMHLISVYSSERLNTPSYSLCLLLDLRSGFAGSAQQDRVPRVQSPSTNGKLSFRDQGLRTPQDQPSSPCSADGLKGLRLLPLSALLGTAGSFSEFDSDLTPEGPS